jgi:hypothetical protein
MPWKRSFVTLRPSSSTPFGERIHCHTCEREISAVAASSIRLKIGTQPLPASHEPMYWMPTCTLLRRPASVIGVSGAKFSRSLALTFTSGRCLPYWFGPGMCLSNTALAIGTRPGCATHVPSQPSVASRSLSARTLAIAASLAAASFLMGICAAMPPIAGALRRWQVFTSNRA